MEDEDLDRLPMRQFVTVMLAGVLGNVVLGSLYIFFAGLLLKHGVIGSLRESVILPLQLIPQLFSQIAEQVQPGDVTMAESVVTHSEVFLHIGVVQVLALALMMAGYLSHFLAVVNVFPIPALDGGQILMQTIQRVARAQGHPISKRVVYMINSISYALILVGIGVLTVKMIV